MGGRDRQRRHKLGDGDFNLSDINIGANRQLNSGEADPVSRRDLEARLDNATGINNRHKLARQTKRIALTIRLRRKVRHQDRCRVLKRLV